MLLKVIDALTESFSFKICTSAGWSDALMAIGDETDCEEPDIQTGSNGDCGSLNTGTLFLVFYLVNLSNYLSRKKNHKMRSYSKL